MPLEFEVDDWVYLKVSPMKGVMKFCKSGKLSPSYTLEDIYESLQCSLWFWAIRRVRIGSSGIPYFYVEVVYCNLSLIVQPENAGIEDILSYEEILVQILYRQVRKLRTKEVTSVKVFERTNLLKKKLGKPKKIYPLLFESVDNADQGTNSFLST